MILGKFVIKGFRYTVADAKDQDGQDMKLLCFKDGHGQAEFHFVFSKDEFDKFLQDISQGTLVIAHRLPIDTKLIL